jgi:ADP-heptose:LPS heptosyltransferase
MKWLDFLAAMKTNSGKVNRGSKYSSDSEALAILGRFRRGRRLILWAIELILVPIVRYFDKTIPISLNEVESILVLEPGQLGDILLLVPFFRSLRSRFPTAHIAVLGRSSVQSLLLEQNLADELIPLRVPWAEYASRWKKYNFFRPVWSVFLLGLIALRRRSFDLAFVAGQGDLRYNAAIWLTGTRRRVGYGFAGGAVFLTDVVSPDLAHPHKTDLCLQLLRNLGIPTLREDRLIHVPAEDQESATKFLSEHGITREDLLIGVHAGARMAVRQWGDDRFQEVARQIRSRFGAKMLWFTDPAQSMSIDEGCNMIPVCLPLPQFLAVLSQCRLLVCNDSGPMHMAAGLGVSTVAIYGPTQPEWFSALGKEHQIVIRRDVWCRPCADRCIFDEPYCLRLISVDQVMEAVTEVIGNISLSRRAWS